MGRSSFVERALVRLVPLLGWLYRKGQKDTNHFRGTSNFKTHPYVSGCPEVVWIRGFGI